jgi:hypothetical protein
MAKEMVDDVEALCDEEVKLFLWKMSEVFILSSLSMHLRQEQSADAHSLPQSTLFPSSKHLMFIEGLEAWLWIISRLYSKADPILRSSIGRFIHHRSLSSPLHRHRHLHSEGLHSQERRVQQ